MNRSVPALLVLFLIFPVSGPLASLSVVADLDSNATNGPDTLQIEPTDTVLVYLWFTGTDSVSSFGLTLGDTSGTLSWVEESKTVVYNTPNGWTDVTIGFDDDGWILLQSTDFAFSSPIQPAFEFARLKFFVTPGDSCGTLEWNPDMSGWFNPGVGESTFVAFESPLICVDSVLDGGEGDSGGDDEEDSEDAAGGGDGQDGGGLDTNADWDEYGAATQDHFGTSVAVAGDANKNGLSDLLVGAPDYGANSEGQAYLYIDFDGTDFSKSQTLEIGLADDKFGFSVATGGDLNGDGIHDILIGAPGYSSGQAAEGVLYVYLSDGGDTVATNAPAQTIQVDVANAQFGYSVAFAGDIDRDGDDDVLVGAPFYENGQTEEGAFYLFKSTGTSAGLDTLPTLFQSNVAGARLGWSVSTAGDINGDGYDDVIVGAPKEEGKANQFGRAYVYKGSGDGLDSLVILDVNVTDAEIGTSVATAGDVDGDGYSDVLVGGPGYPDASSDDGAVFLFRGSSSGVSNSVVDTIKIAASEDSLGISVFTAGDVNGDGYADVVLGAKGSAHLVHGYSGGLDTANALTINDGLSSDEYGVAVSTAGDVNGDGYSDIVIGAPKAEDGSTDQGAAFLYLGAPFLPDTSAVWSGDMNTAAISYGQSVATAGDVNGDGYSDVIVGAYWYEYEDNPEGAAFVYLGSDSGLADIPYDTLGIVEDGARFGYSVACAGDVDNDGYSDIVVGAPRKGNNRGIVYVFEGGNPPSWSDPSDSLEIAVDLGQFGFSVASAGDVNADGYGDVIVGAYYWGTAPQYQQGRAFVYLGSETGLDSVPVNTLAPPGSGLSQEYGHSVASAGDINGDGYSDVIVGAPLFDWTNNDNVNDSGYVAVYLGYEGGVHTTPFYEAMGSLPDERLGFSVASAGDVDGDGYSDLIIGGIHYEYPEYQEGRAIVVLGGSGPLENPVWESEGNEGGAQTGYSVAPAGDVNGDGYGDILVGSNLFDYNGAVLNAGRAELFLGSTDGPVDPASWSYVPNKASADYGTSVAMAGDVNGDGYGDIVIGAVGYDSNALGGKAFVYYGNGSGGLDRIPRQAQKNGDPLFLLGRTKVDNEFALKALARSPIGRDSVSMEWEIRKKRVPFQGTVSGRSQVIDTGQPAAGIGSASALTDTVGSLQTNYTYRWRLRLASRHPYFPRTPWFAFPYNSPAEIDLRTGYTDSSVGSREGNGVTPVVRLDRTRSNPFNPSVSIRYSVSLRSRVTMSIFDVRGRLVRELVDRVQESGSHVVSWDGTEQNGRGAASGVYFVRLTSSEEVLTKKILLLR